MSKLQDLTGQRFGRLTVLSRELDYVTPKGQHKTCWKCKCDCGNYKITTATALKTGTTSSCGCYGMENRILYGHLNAKHGGFGTRLYRIYRGMWQRCYDKNEKQYMRYGYRGVDMCEQWLGEHGFENFREWSYQNGYKETLTIDRIDNSKGYSPENCRWATVMEQQNNRDCNVFLEANGERHTLAEWSRITGINVATIKSRRKLGWKDVDIVTKPIDIRKTAKKKINTAT